MGCWTVRTANGHLFSGFKVRPALVKRQSLSTFSVSHDELLPLTADTRFPADGKMREEPVSVPDSALSLWEMKALLQA